MSIIMQITFEAKDMDFVRIRKISSVQNIFRIPVKKHTHTYILSNCVLHITPLTA